MKDADQGLLEESENFCSGAFDDAADIINSGSGISQIAKRKRVCRASEGRRAVPRSRIVLVKGTVCFFQFKSTIDGFKVFVVQEFLVDTLEFEVGMHFLKCFDYKN